MDAIWSAAGTPHGRLAPVKGSSRMRDAVSLAMIGCNYEPLVGPTPLFGTHFFGNNSAMPQVGPAGAAQRS